MQRDGAVKVNTKIWTSAIMSEERLTLSYNGSRNHGRESHFNVSDNVQELGENLCRDCMRTFIALIREELENCCLQEMGWR